MSLDTLLPILAGLTSLSLAVAVLFRRPLGTLQWSFALGMVGFTAESAAVLMLLGTGIEPAEHARWVRALGLTRALIPVPWMFVIVSLVQHGATRHDAVWRLAVTASTALSAVGVAAAAAAELRLVVVRGPFEGARLLGTARLGAIAEILLVVAVLVGLESCLRIARGQNRRRIKYLVLSLGGIFLIRFYLQSQILLFHAVIPEYLKIGSATLLIANVLMAAAVMRERLRTVDVAISRQIVLRSVVAVVLGLYLLAVGALGWLVNYLEIPEKLFWGSLAVFVSALAVAGVLLSDRIRWRVKRFVGLHFYRSKYDYREQLVAFTRRMASFVTLDEIGPQLLDAVTEAVGATRAALYLSTTDRAHYLLTASSGCAPSVSAFEPGSPLPARFQTNRDPIILDNDVAERLALAKMIAILGEGAVAAPLVWRADLAGFLLIGPERTGAPYGNEDLVFIATLSEQAAGRIVTAAMSEALARARESRAFDHLASVVAHDIKNSVSALSMLTRTALRHFDDPEFQRDSIRMLSRTVDRMKRLLARLSSPAEAASLRFETVDLVQLVDEATTALREDTRIRLVRDIRTVPTISGDSDALLRVVQNLVTNAVEAIDGQGTVTVTLEASDGRAVVSVSDTGRGMSEEFVRRLLFAPFRTTKRGGWGIGLYQSREVVELHRGSIAVVSREGVGTTFRVALPLVSDRADALEPQAVAASSAHEGVA